MTVEEYANRYLEQEMQGLSYSHINDYKDLSIYEAALIYKYSNDGYEDLNEELRKSAGKNISNFGKLLNKCLAKLPNYEGLVYRCADLSLRELNRYIEAESLNKPITEHSFVSTSKSELTAISFGKNTKFEIYSRTGKEIERFAKFGLHNPPNETCMSLSLTNQNELSEGFS